MSLIRVEFQPDGTYVAKLAKSAGSEKPDNDREFSLRVPFVKLNEAKRITKGPVLRPEIRDRQNSIVSADEIEQAAHSFVRRLNKGDATGPATGPGLMHTDFKDIGIHIVESWITDFAITYSPDNRLVRASAEYADLINKTSGNIEIPADSWMMAMYCESDDVWKGVVNGTFKGYSIGGYAVRVYDEES